MNKSWHGLNSVFTLQRVLIAPYFNVTDVYCHSQLISFSDQFVFKPHRCWREEMIYEASFLYQGGRRCVQKALRTTLWECEQIYQSGLSLRPRALSRGWPSSEFHHWNREDNRECVLKDKGPISQRSDEVSMCASVSDTWLRTVQQCWHFSHRIFTVNDLHVVDLFVTNDC